MANKKVSQLTSKPSVLVTDLFPIADPSTGQLYKTTISDLGTAIGSGVSSVNGLVGAVVLDTDDIQELVSPTNKWFTDTRARAALSASSPLAYNSGTGVFSIPAATSSQNGYLTSTDWTTFNNKLSTATAASTYVPYTGATANVNLGQNYSLTAALIIKSGGTSTQFLKADGTIDTNTYLTTSAAASTYLPLTGGTLTGGLNGTFGNFSSYVNAQTLDVNNTTAGNALRINHTNTSYHAVSITATGGSALYATGSVTVIGTLTATGVLTAQSGLANGSGQSFTLPSTTGTLALTSQLSAYLPLAGGTLTGALSGTSATFTGQVNIFNSAALRLSRFSTESSYYGDVAYTAGGLVLTSVEGYIKIGKGAASSPTTYLSIVDGGAATFSSSVLANSFNIAANGTIASNGFWGTLHTKGAGSYADWSLISGGGSGIMWNPTGTLNMSFGGNVGIGTTSPGQLLHLYGTSIRPTIESTNNGSYASLRFVGKNTSGTSRTFEVGLNISADDVWQITDGASNLLSVSNVGALKSPFTYTNTTMNLANLYMGSTGTFERSVASSRRFKENINSWSDNGLNTILALNPVTFTYKSDYYKNPETLMLGLIAEEVAEVSPYLADFENEDRTGQVENVRYAHIVVPLIKAVQELKAELDTLKNK